LKWYEHRRWAKVFGLSEKEARDIDDMLDFMTIDVNGLKIRFPHGLARKLTHNDFGIFAAAEKHGVKGMLYAWKHLQDDNTRKTSFTDFESVIITWKILKKHGILK